MFKKRLVRVEVSFQHGGESIPMQTIDLLPGQTFRRLIGSDELWGNGHVVKAWDWKAGYTVTYQFFYQ